MRVLLAGSRGSVCIQLLAVLKHTSSSRLSREQSVGLARGEPMIVAVVGWFSLRVAKASTAVVAVLPDGR